MCMTPCERFRRNIFDLVDGELDVHQKHELEKHLKSCSCCALFFSQCRQLRKRLQNLPRLAASETFHLLLRERIRRDSQENGELRHPSLSPDQNNGFLP